MQARISRRIETLALVSFFLFFALSAVAQRRNITVTISPTSASVAAGATRQFTATVTNTSDTSVTWEVNGISGGNSSVGTISGAGLYKAPASFGSRTSVTVTAISDADDTKSASATVTFTTAAPVSVSVSPTTVSLQAGGVQKFTATVQNTSNTSVTWQVNGVTGGNASNGTISTSGNYTAPATVTAQKVVTVTAISQADTTKSASAAVTLTVAQPVVVTVSPLSASLLPGATQKFTATVQNSSNTSVTWRINGINGGNATVGTVSTSGNYKAPATVTAQTLVTVTAVSQADTTKSASAQVTLLVPPPVTVTVTPLSASLIGGAAQKFTATVQNASNTGVTWQVNDINGGNSTVGTISTSGNYRAPATIAAQAVVTIKAISTQDSTKSATALVTLNPVTVTISPIVSVLLAGGQQPFTASVQNGSSNSVTWLVNGVSGGNATLGTVSSSGLYKAPATVAAQTVVTVTARSQADTTKSASAAVTLNPPTPPVSVTLTPPTSGLLGGGTQLFSATVINSSNPAVTWFVNNIAGGNATVGTIADAGPGNGLYTAPAAVAVQTVVTVKAVSVADATKSASSTITLTPLSVGISPLSISLPASGTQTFIANVQNATNPAVTWLVNGIPGGNLGTVGAISGNGEYQAPPVVPAQTSVTVKAVSVSDPTKSASATVTLLPLSVTLSPPAIGLTAGGMQSFVATVQNSTDQSVTWFVNDVAGGNTAFGSISDGAYVAPSPIAAETTATVKAVSVADTTKFATAIVTLKPLSVSISPGTASLAGGETATFAATVAGSSNQVVKWFVNETENGDLATIGSILDGVYTAPSVGSLTTVVVKAVSDADSSKFATATVTLNPVSVGLLPATAALGAAGTQTFTATVQNTGNKAVTWFIDGVAGGSAATGTISAEGAYIAPASITTQTTVMVKAVSGADPDKFATAVITLNPVSITLSPDTITLGGGATQTFAAEVKYAGSTDVTWYVNDTAAGDTTTVGSIVAGLYTAPMPVATQTVVMVKAVSQSDLSKFATAQVTLNPVTVTISPDAPTVGILKTKQFTSTVQYTADTSVKWQVNGAEGGDDTNGHITAAGLYTAPGSVPDPVTVTVTTVSQADPAQSASTQVTITAATGKSYYVATTGVDTAAGTIDAPWKTISRAAAATSGVVAGDTVFVRGGIYKESVTVAVSGAALPGPITFQSYPGELAILDGTGLTVPTTPHGMFHLDSRSYITISGFEIRNYQTASASGIPAGIWVTGSGSNIQILNNIVHDIKTSSERNGQAYGISIYGTGATLPLDTITIDGNQVYNLKTGGSESVNVDGNVSNFTITHNVVHDNDNIAIDAIGFEGVSPNAALDYARNGIISDNLIYNISGINNPGEGNDYDADGVYVDGGSQILIERNFIHHVDIGIEAAAEHKGKTSSYITIRNNVIYASNSMGITIGGYDNKRGGADHCVIVNNTLYGNDTKNTGSGEFQVQYFATNNVFKNNIVYGTSQGLLINNYTNSSANPVDVDYNLYFSPLASTAARFVWNGTARTGLGTFQTATGKDAHSRYLDPLFLDLSAFNLRVQPTSPAVDQGIDLTPDVNGAKDIDSNPRVQGANIDIGAYEQ